MRRLVYLAFVMLVAAVAAWLYSQRETLALQWDCYEVAQAKTYAEFQQRIERFQRESLDYNRLRALVERWQTGNATFDEYLVRYLLEGTASDALREVFSRELNWREGRFAAWAEAWKAQKADADEQIASIRRYLQTVYDAPRNITWRDVLDFQAALELTGHGQLAHRLTLDNWRVRFERWPATEHPRPSSTNYWHAPGRVVTMVLSCPPLHIASR